MVWHQALQIWLMQWPRPPNCYLLWGHFMFEVIRLLHFALKSLLLRTLLLVKRLINNQSKHRSHMRAQSQVTNRQLTEKCFKVVSQSWAANMPASNADLFFAKFWIPRGSIGGSWLAYRIPTKCRAQKKYISGPRRHEGLKKRLKNINCVWHQALVWKSLNMIEGKLTLEF